MSNMAPPKLGLCKRFVKNEQNTKMKFNGASLVNKYREIFMFTRNIRLGRVPFKILKLRII